MDKPDYMSETEFKDLEEMKSKVSELKVSRMDYLISMLRYSPDDFKHSGYKNLEDATVKILNTTKSEIEKINRDYIKKYPD